MGNLVVKKIEDTSDREKKSIDDFILDKNTNGEFINSLNYLAYHQEGRFADNSIVVVDEGSGVIRGVFVAAENPSNSKSIISHPGTTFAGIIINRKLSIKNAEEIVNMMLSYYEKRYDSIIVKVRPEFFSVQPFGMIPYFLMERGYQYSMSGLSNVIDISQIENEDALFLLYDTTKRNQIRKVLREKKFVFEEKKELRKEVWIAMNDTLEQKHNVHSTHTFEEMNELMGRVPNYISTYYVDTIDGEYGAFALIYRFKNVFHTQYLDTNYKYTGQYPNLLLIHELIQIARKDGYSKFSFGVSTENDGKFLNDGLFNYKAGYGGGSIIQEKYVWNR